LKSTHQGKSNNMKTLSTCYIKITWKWMKLEPFDHWPSNKSPIWLFKFKYECPKWLSSKSFPWEKASKLQNFKV